MSIIFEIIFWFLVFLGTGGLLFCSVYTLILFADLSVDHINPIDLCEYVNRLVFPEYAGHLLLTLFMLSRGYITAVLLNIPLILFHFKRYSQRKHHVESTSIFNELDKERKIAQIKLAFHLVLFFIYLYYFIAMLVSQ